MIDVTEILVHWHAGRSLNEMSQSLGVDRKTIRKYVAPAAACPAPNKSARPDVAVLSGSCDCCALWGLSAPEELLQCLRGVVLVIVADQKPGQRMAGHMCNTCCGSGG